MSETTTKKKPVSAETATKPPKKEAVAKPARQKLVPTQVDLKAIAKLQHCELWTKKQVKFDHPEWDVMAHVLIYAEGDHARKLCFNTYNGTLGKKCTSLPIEAFLSGTVQNGKQQWFKITDDLDKVRAQLKKAQYERVHVHH